jgi:hypothetical protein
LKVKLVMQRGKGRRLGRGLRGHDQEARGVGMLILDVAGEDLQAVDLRRQRRRDRRPRRVGVLAQQPRGAGGVAHRLGLQLQPLHHLAALRQRDRHGGDGLQVFQPNPRVGHQLEVDRLEPFADDLQARGGQEVVHVGDPPRDGVLHRDHAELAAAGLHRFERLLEGGAGDRLQLGKGRGAGLVAVGAQLALEGDASPAHDNPPSCRLWA